MKFSEIIGQDKVIEILKSFIKSKEIANSYAFYGPKGCGKKTTALAFAQSLNCKNLQDFDSCGLCDSCRKIEKETYEDVALFSAKKAKGFNIETAKEVKEWISLKTSKSEYKIAIIEAAEGITLEAENCLLKTLEDPPPNSCVILLATSPNQLLPTVNSRCVPIFFKTLSEKDVKKILSKINSNFNEDFINIAYELTNADVEEIIKIENIEFITKTSAKLNDIFKDKLFIFPPKFMEIITKLSKLAQDSLNLSQKDSFLFILKILLYNLQKNLELMINDRLVDKLNYLKEEINNENKSFETIKCIEDNIKIIEEIYNCYNDINKFANPTSALTVLAIKLSDLIKIKRECYNN